MRKGLVIVVLTGAVICCLPPVRKVIQGKVEIFWEAFNSREHDLREALLAEEDSREAEGFTYSQFDSSDRDSESIF